MVGKLAPAKSPPRPPDFRGIGGSLGRPPAVSSERYGVIRESRKQQHEQRHRASPPSRVQAKAPTSNHVATPAVPSNEGQRDPPNSTRSQHVVSETFSGVTGGRPGSRFGGAMVVQFQLQVFGSPQLVRGGRSPV